MVRWRSLNRQKERLSRLLQEDALDWWQDLPLGAGKRRRKLHKLLATESGNISIKTLAELLGCSTRTVFRDILWLKSYSARFSDGQERYRLAVQIDADFKKSIQEKKQEIGQSDSDHIRKAQLIEEAMDLQSKRTRFLFRYGLYEAYDREMPDIKVMTTEELRLLDAELSWKQTKIECQLDQMDWLLF